MIVLFQALLMNIVKDMASVSSYNLPLPSLIHLFMKVAHLNCRSLLSKSDEVFMFMRDNCIDINTLSETWLDESVSDAEVFSDNMLLEGIGTEGVVVLQLFCLTKYVFVCALIIVRVLWNHFGLSYFLVVDVLYCCVVFTDHPLIVIFLIILL